MVNEVFQLAKVLAVNEVGLKELSVNGDFKSQFKRLNSPIALDLNKKNELNTAFKSHLEGNTKAKQYFNDNPDYKRGFEKLSDTGLENYPEMCRFFSPDNMQEVRINKMGDGKYSFLSKDGKALGECSIKNRILKVNTFESDSYLNPLVNQQYKVNADGSWPDPDKCQTMLPNFTIDINKGRHIVRTDDLGRKSYQKDELRLGNSAYRDNAAQVNSKELFNGYSSDQGGHTCAASLGGIRESINYTPMHKEVNENGEIRNTERVATSYLKAGSSVTQETSFNYNDKDGVGGRYRPESYDRTLYVDGVRKADYKIENYHEK